MSNLQKGIEMVGHAIRLDSEAKLGEAINAYQQALSFLEAAFMEESDINRKNQILEKMREYNDRMQLLNDTLSQTQTPSSSFVDPPFPSQPSYEQTQSPYGSQSFGSQPLQAPPAQPPNEPSNSPPPYEQITTQSPYGSQQASSPYSAPHGDVSSPYGNLSQGSVVRAPYDSSSSTGMYTPPPRAPYEAPQPSTSQQEFQRPMEPPTYKPPPPADVWGDSFSPQTQPNAMNSSGSFSQAPQHSTSPYGSFQGPSQSTSQFGGNTQSHMPPQGNMQSFQGQSQQAAQPQSSQFGSGYPSQPSQATPQGSTSPYGSFQGHPQPLAQPSGSQDNIRSSFQTQSLGSSQQSNSMDNRNSQPSMYGSQGGVQPSMNANGPALPMMQEDKYNAFLVHLQKEHPRSVANIQVALLVAEEAKKADRSAQYQDALDLYTETLERFILVYNRESNQNIKQTLHNTINLYMQRAEKIKEVCKIVPRRVPDQLQNVNASLAASRESVVASNPSPKAEPQRHSMYAAPPQQSAPSPQRQAQVQPERNPSSSGLLQDPTGTNATQEDQQSSYVGKPIQITNETKSLLARQRLRLTVSVKNNLVFPGDKLQIYVKVENRSTMVVQMLKVTLRRIEKNQKYDAKGRQVMATDALKIHKQEFYQGSIFPLPAESNYTGELLYTIPHGLKPTNVSQRGIFEREYDLSVQCVLSMRKNLSVRFPVVIGPG